MVATTVIAEFAVNNKVYTATKVSPFMTNYRRELQMRVNIRRKRKVEKAMEFIEKMRKVQKEAEAVLRKAQEEIKKQADKERQKVKE